MNSGMGGGPPPQETSYGGDGNSFSARFVDFDKRFVFDHAQIDWLSDTVAHAAKVG